MFEFSFFFIHPVYLFPSFCVFFKPLIVVEGPILRVVFILVLFMLVNTCLSVVWTLFYRFSQGFPGVISTFFDKSKFIYLIYAFVHVLIYSAFMPPIILGSIDEEAKIQQVFLKENPDLGHLVNQPMACFANTPFFFLALSFVLFLFFCVGTVLITILYYQIKASRRESRIESTSRMQLMLFKALLAQLIIGYILLLFPGLFSYLLIGFEVEGAGKVYSISCAIMSFHSLCDYCVMLYFIKPYRKALIEALGIWKNTSVSRVPLFVKSAMQSSSS